MVGGRLEGVCLGLRGKVSYGFCLLGVPRRYRVGNRNVIDIHVLFLRFVCLGGSRSSFWERFMDQGSMSKVCG